MAQPHQILWLEEVDNNVVEHINEHGVTVEEAEAVLKSGFDNRQRSCSHTGRWIVKGYTSAGRFLVVVFDYVPAFGLVIPVTAYEPTDEGI